jgi:hypothetical protein
MSVPLRKDEFIEKDELVEENLTTADLAQGKRAAPSGDRLGLSEDRSGPMLAERPAGSLGQEGRDAAPTARPVEARTAEVGSAFDARSASDPEPLFPSNELQELRNRWSGVQTAFVDEPRRAVEQADGLVASAMKRLAEVFAEERSKLEKQWDRGGNVSTSRCNVIVPSFTDCCRYKIAGQPKRHLVSRGKRLLKSYAKDSALSESLAIMTPLFTFGQPLCWPLLCGSEQCGRVSGTNSHLRDRCSSIPGEVSVAVIAISPIVDRLI